jgi:aryl-alcohol dehydrogenase-like predicted oxidoreductase
MEFRQLGKSGLQVPVLCFGTGTFGGGNEFFQAWGATDVKEATRLIGVCLDSGVNFFDTADVYSEGLSEEILGEAIRQVPRQTVLISTKATFPFGEGPNNTGSSRHHLSRQIEGSLKRLKTDYIDVYHMHGFDALTPIEETLSTLDEAVHQGKLYRSLEFLRVAPSKIARYQCAVWMGAVCRPPGLLFSRGPRLRMGVDAASPVGGHRSFGMESSRLGATDGEDSPRSASTGGEPAS